MKINWKYNIGDNIKQSDSYGNAIADYVITNRKICKKKVNVKKDNRGCELQNLKYYEYKCNICGASELWKQENKIGINKCSCCAGRIRIRGINTIGDKYPKYLSYFANDDAYNPKLSINSKYNVICPICKHTKNMIIGNLVAGKFYCDYCNSFRIKRPNLIKYLVNECDADSAYSSPKYVDTECPNCKYRRIMNLRNLAFQGYSCPICSDHISFGEKFIMELLKQLNIKYVHQLSHKDYSWCKTYKYDFYIEPDIIIEVHGIQHYTDTFSRIGGRTAIDEHRNDDIKKNLATENGINHYIVIDCSKSTDHWIYSSICSSELSKLYNLSMIDWNKCTLYAQSNILASVCNYYNQHENCSYKELSEQFHIQNSTVYRYLKRGNELNLCVFDTNKRKEQQKKPVNIYFNNVIVYKCKSINEVSDIMLTKYNIDIKPGCISRYCNGKVTCRKYPKFRFEFA